MGSRSSSLPQRKKLLTWSQRHPSQSRLRLRARLSQKRNSQRATDLDLQRHRKHSGSPLFNRGSQTAVTVSTREFNYVHASAKNVHKEKRKIIDPKNGTDLIDAAEEAGLRYVSENQPGYTHKAKNDDFEYLDTEG